MLTSLAIANYQSIRDLIILIGRLNLVTGPNGSGKSSLYRALRLLGATAQGGIASLAREGGLSSTLWAGPILRPAALLVDRRESAAPRSTSLELAGPLSGFT